jgi:hypothetical protein
MKFAAPCLSYQLCALVSGVLITAVAQAAPSTAKLGTRIDNLSFRDPAGQATTLRDLKGKKATVIIFLSFECPMSKSYSQPLADLVRAFPEVGFLGLTTNEEETPGQVAQAALEFKLPFPVLKDADLMAADALKAQTTPEAFLLDADLILRYRGRIDDGYAARLKKKAQPTRQDLRLAIADLLAGRPVSEPATEALGCLIPRRKPAPLATTNLTFYHDVLPILQANCQPCHRSGQVGPFSLQTYRQAVNWAGDIREFTRTKRMPPWPPIEGLPFRNQPGFSAQDQAILNSWVEGGVPEGNPEQAPPLRRWSEGWQLGAPDLVLTLPDDFHLGASGNDLLRCFALPTRLTEDKVVAAFDLRPSNPRIVHHALLAVDSSGAARRLEQRALTNESLASLADHGPGYTVEMGFGFEPALELGSWMPGQTPCPLPKDAGFLLPRGADLVLQVHYHRDGRPGKDRTTLGLYFAKRPVTRHLQTLPLTGHIHGIRPGDRRHVAQGTIWVDKDCTLYSVMPHMHLLGREIMVTLTPPSGKPKTLLRIADWDYHWQQVYVLAEPLAVAAGCRFDVSAIYDNSARNPHNPNTPPRLVIFGQRLTDEMCAVSLGIAANGSEALRPLHVPPKLRK